MALPDLTGQFIQDTYKRVLTVGEGGNMFDGTGSLFIPLSASHEIIKEVSSSYADTASLAQELVSDKRATAKNYVYIAHGTTLQSGTTAALYLGTSHAGMDIARFNDSSLVLGGVTQNYGWRIFGIKHGLQESTYTTEIDNLIATGSMKVSGSIDINLQSGSAFTITENDVDQENRLTFEYDQGDPTLIIAGRSAESSLHLKYNLAGEGLKLTNQGLITRQVSGVEYGLRLSTTCFQPETGNQLDLGYYNDRWKTLYLYTGNKVSWGTTTNSDLASIRHTAGTNTLTITGSSDVTLDIKGNTIVTGSLNTTGSLAAFENDVLIGRIATSPQQPDRSLTIHSYSDSAIIFQNHGTWSKTKLYSSFNGTLILDEQGGTATPGGRLILGGSGDTGTNKENYLWIRGDNDDDAVHIYLGANSTTYSSEIGIERQEGTGINYESDIALRAAAGLSQHKSEYIFSRKGMFQAQDAGFTVSGSGQVFVNITASSLNPASDIQNFSETFVVSGSGRFTDALSVDGTTRTLFTSCSMVYSGSNVTQITQSYEAGTQQITNILYSGSFADGNPLSVSVTGSDGVNKLYSMTYSGGNITQILVT